MNECLLDAVENQVTYRFLSHEPENGILSCGFMRKQTAQKSQINFVIPYYSCFLLLDGSGEYWDETGIHVPLLPGSVCQRLPNRLHSTRVDGDGKWLEFYVSFGKCVFDGLQTLGLLNTDTPVFTFPDPQKQVPAFQKLLARMSSASEPMLASCLLEAQETVLTLHRRSVLHPGISPMIARACEILEKDLERKLALQDVAKQLCIGYETFRKQFQQEMQQSPDEYRQCRRMTTAQVMLMEGQSVKAVAKFLGYGDAYAFSKQFKRFCGHAPALYRKNVQGKEIN